MKSPAYHLQTLGTLELWSLDVQGNRQEQLLGSGKPVALLAFCLSARHREHSRDSLASLFWSDADPERARQSLRQALWRIRRAVGDCVQVSGDAVRGVASHLTSDREQFLSALNTGDIGAAVECYAGPYLAGMSFPNADEFDDWASLERRYLEDQLVRNIEPLLQRQFREGRPSLARGSCERLLQVAPNSVDAFRVAIDALVSHGEIGAARRAIEKLEQLFRTLDSRASPSMAALIARASSADATTPVSPVLPVAFDLVGREETFAIALQSWQRARRGEHAILIIGGIAGIGKSRLLTAVAERCRDRTSGTLTVRANVGERDVPFGFTASLVRGLVGLPGAAGVSGESARELVAIDPALSAQFHATPSPHDAGEVVRRRALAVIDLITAITHEGPLALFLDDLHWIDAASRQLLTIVFGRTDNLPLLVVAATRGTLTGLFDTRTSSTVSLTVLSRETIIDAIASSGGWPDNEDATAFIHAIADNAGGIPLQAVERLALAEERGLVVRTDGHWSSDNWSAAIEAASVTSPLYHRLTQCTDEERQILLILAVAGTRVLISVVEESLRLARGDGTSMSAHTSLLSLEGKGLVTPFAERWSTSHDLVAEQVLQMSTMEDQRRNHHVVGLAYATVTDVERLMVSVRHLLIADRPADAGHAFARLVALARANRDHRSTDQLLDTISAERTSRAQRRILIRAVPLRYRITWPHPGSVIAIASVLLLTAALFAWQAMRKPKLMFAQRPLLLQPVPTLGGGAYRLVPAAIITQSTAAEGANASVMVHVEGDSLGIEMVANDSARMIDGRAAFGAFRFRATRSPAILRFTAPGHESIELTLPATIDDVANEPHGRAHLKIVSGRLNGARLDADNPTIRAKAGTVVAGVLQVEYDAPWPNASVWLSSAPTWGNPAELSRDLLPVTTPVRQEVLDVSVAFVLPEERGRRWVVFTIDAEPAGGFAISNTNWTVTKAVWGDGNDLTALSDDAIRDARKQGRVVSWRAFPASHRADGCQPRLRDIGAQRLQYCKREAAFAAIEVVVD